VAWTTISVTNTTIFVEAASASNTQSIFYANIVFTRSTGTFTSQELQQTVSRAIRSSANESFIRLLPLQDVDGTIPNEIERLRILKATTSSRYRFCVQRRTMLLQALNSFSTASPIQQDRDGGTAYLSSLALQLAEITSECDRLADELVKITDQLGNLSKLTDTHWSSALAIALRKVCNRPRSSRLLGQSGQRAMALRHVPTWKPTRLD
jgi:hypothetical protein